MILFLFLVISGTGGTSTITVITDQTISANEQRTVNNHNQSVLQPTSSVVTSISPIQANIIGSGTIVSTNNSQANNDSQSSNINNHQIQTHHSHTNPLIQDAHKSVVSSSCFIFFSFLLLKDISSLIDKIKRVRAC